MDKVWVVLLASAPFVAFLVWVAWWLIADAIREHRRSRAVARFAQQYGDERNRHG